MQIVWFVQIVQRRFTFIFWSIFDGFLIALPCMWNSLFDRFTMYVKFIELHDFFIVFSCRKWIQILLKNLLAAIGEFDRDWVLIAVELLIIENQESLEIVTDGLSPRFLR